MNIKSLLIATILGASVLSSAALAQNNRAQNAQNQQGYGPGGQQGQGWGGAYGPGDGRGMGGGFHHGGRGGMGRHKIDAQMMNLITQDEWVNFKIQMRATKTFDECKNVQSAHWQLLETRAKEKNLSFTSPMQNGWNKGPCERMKFEGILK